MKNIPLTWGALGAAILIVLNLLWLLVWGIPDSDDFAMGEVIGYATIVIALVPVFFGIRRVRDRVFGGVIPFWKACLAGLGIIVWPGVAFALYNLLYVYVIDPDFSEKYMAYALESARSRMNAAEFEQYAATMEAQSALYADPFFQSLVMFLTVFLVGLVVVIISALVLRRRSAS